MNNISSCCVFLDTNESLRNVLCVVLACGNYLNGGNKQRGQADGFSIDILPKLRDLKTTANDDNLLGFIIRFCIERYDLDKGTVKAVLPVPEPGDLEKCKHVDFEQERLVCTTLYKEVVQMRKTVEVITSKAKDDHKEPFCRLMNDFLDRADNEAKEITDHVEESAAKFLECMKKYKFAPKKGLLVDTKPEEFFLAWHLFAEDYKNVWKKEQVRSGSYPNL